MRLVNNPLLRWDRCDTELISRFLRTFRVVFLKCRNFGHYAADCPHLTGSSVQCRFPHARAGISPRFQNASPASGYRPVQSGFHPRAEFRPPAQHTCWYFNSNGYCSNSRCSQAHVCSSCGGSHPLLNSDKVWASVSPKTIPIHVI